MIDDYIIFFYSNISITIYFAIILAVIDNIIPIVPREMKLLVVKLFWLYAIVIDINKPIKPVPVPRAMNIFPVLILFFPINIPPIITAIPPKDSIKLILQIRFLGFGFLEICWLQNFLLPPR